MVVLNRVEVSLLVIVSVIWDNNGCVLFWKIEYLKVNSYYRKKIYFLNNVYFKKFWKVVKVGLVIIFSIFGRVL